MSAQAAAASPPSQVFSPRAVLLMLLVGVFSFSAYFVLSAYAPDLRSGDDGGAHALSKSAVGYAALVRLLEATGTPTAINHTDPKDIHAQASLMVLTPELETSAQDIDQAVAHEPVTLVILPKWRTLPDQSRPGWVQAAGVVPPELITPMLAKRFGKVTISRRSGRSPLALERNGQPAGVTGPIDQLQTLAAPALAPVLTDASGGVVLARAADNVFLLSDPDLLDTQGLKDLATARLAMGLIQDLRVNRGPVLFDVTLNGYGRGRSLLRLAFEPPFLGATLSLAAVALLMGLHAASRFGAPREAERALALGKAALVESSAGLIRMARREPHMATGYAELCRNQVAAALGAGRLTGAELEAVLDRRGEQVGAGRLSDVTAEAGAPKDRSEVIAAARRFFQWRVEMTRERR